MYMYHRVRFIVSMSAEDLVLSTPSVDLDLDEMYNLEAASYPIDEAATHEGMKFRLRVAGACFVVAKAKHQGKGGEGGGGEIIGFVNGTKTLTSSLTHESMSTHDPDGKLLCVHSVVVREAYRRRGYGVAMLRAYCERMRKDPGIAEIRLLCKPYLVSFYQQAGFTLLGESDVVHGKDAWMEMKMDVHETR